MTFVFSSASSSPNFLSLFPQCFVEPHCVILLLKATYKVSSPRESHPQALSEPDLNLSAHPAPIIQPLAELPSASGKTVSVPSLRFYPASFLLLCDVFQISYTSFAPNALKRYSCIREIYQLSLLQKQI